MNSESAKELLKWRKSVLVCRHGTFLTSSEFFMTIALAIPPLTVKNKGGGVALIRDRVLNRANTVGILEILLDHTKIKKQSHSYFILILLLLLCISPLHTIYRLSQTIWLCPKYISILQSRYITYYRFLNMFNLKKSLRTGGYHLWALYLPQITGHVLTPRNNTNRAVYNITHLTLMLLLANFASTKLCTWKMIETMPHGYSSESTPTELSNEYEHGRV